MSRDHNADAVYIHLELALSALNKALDSLEAAGAYAPTVVVAGVSKIGLSHLYEKVRLAERAVHTAHGLQGVVVS